MTQTLRSIAILDSLSSQFKLEYPNVDIPEEIMVNPELIDSSVKFFCEDGANLKADQIPINIETFIVDTFDNECHWKHLKVLTESASKTTIRTLYLGHDGCVKGEKGDIESVIKGLPGVQSVHYCGYYAQYEDDLEEICAKFNVATVEIY